MRNSRFSQLAVTTSGSINTSTALAPVGTDFRFAVFIAAAGNAAAVTIGPSAAPTAAAIAAAGTGYINGDIVLLVGGTYSEQAQLIVTSVNAVTGAVTGIAPYGYRESWSGCYSVTPANAVSTTGGTGTGLTLNMTWVGPANVYSVTAGQVCDLIPVMLPLNTEPLDAGDWSIKSSSASQAGVLLYM